ncbi:MAG: LpxL/LpxP family Kdo(2)-lipid IV(A) lauroyl/palmitoleoyl acyltransferase [Nitrococcus sp.]|nr:LpxL/LpxP family Kdo(2)-lipid IV(A) lauroyl/palmitoleoyl acyltransferase [Nitrococcus sp.]
MSEHQPRRIYAARYWSSWLGMGLLRCIARLPFPWALALGGLVGRLSYYLLPYRRRVVEANLALCLPDLTAAERNALVRENLRCTGRGLVEVGIAWWGKAALIQRLGHFEGLEHLRQALDEGRGVILLGAHFTPLELTGRIMLSQIPFQVIYRENRNPVIERFMRESRQRLYQQTHQRRDLRALVRALRERCVVWYPPDQDYGRSHSVFAPFFGIPAATITVTSRLARLTGATVIPTYGTARRSATGYTIRLHPPLRNFPSGDEVLDATRLNAVLEAEVRCHPEQYYWVHRRFKTRPDGAPEPYPPRRRCKRMRHEP